MKKEKKNFFHDDFTSAVTYQFAKFFLWMSRNLSSSSLTHSKRLKYWNTQWEIIWVKASTRQGGNVYSVLLCFFFFSRFVEFVLAAGAGGGGRVVAKIANIRYK